MGFAKYVKKHFDKVTACQKCGKWFCKGDEGERHHLKPVSHGGKNGIYNLVKVCKDCHKELDWQSYVSPEMLMGSNSFDCQEIKLIKYLRGKR